MKFRVGVVIVLLSWSGFLPARAGARDMLALAPCSRALGDLTAVVEAEMAAGRVPGAVVVVGHEGRVVYRRAFGARALEPAREPMTDDTIFDLASLTKVIATTTAVMQLAEAGQLELDAPAARYWPAFGRDGKERITIRDLLMHTSGLRADLDLERSWWSGAEATLARVTAERPVAAPGSRTLYSDVGFLVLGEVVRRVAGQPLDRYCETHVFAPLGMQTTMFAPPAELAPRIAPTTRSASGMLRGSVHDPTARRMDGIAGHAGLFSTAADLARFAQMMLDGGIAGGTRVLSAASVDAMVGSPSQERGLGWETNAASGTSWHAAFSAGAYGHTGYTGTALWIDPATRTYLIVLTNRVHPDDRGQVRTLRTRVATLVAAAVAPVPAAPSIAIGAAIGEEPNGDRQPGAQVALGIDVLAAESFAPLVGRRVGVITNQTGRDRAGRRTIDVLRTAPGVTLAAIFTPEHGLDGTLDRRVASTWEPRLGVPIFSLYGEVKRPTDAMLDGIDALVFDVQDVGVRFYTYVTTMAYAMEAAARLHLPFYVLDRPNPIGAAAVQGPLLDDDLRSFTGYFPLPVRYGMTIGELATLLNAENAIGADLHVVRMRGYARNGWYDETGLAWVPPSPNLRSLGEATLYPGVALLEGANVSVGRGTETPFELVGAPWIDAEALTAFLNEREIAGVQFAPASFVPTSDVYRGKPCRGIRILLLDRDRLDAPGVGVEIASALRRLYPRHFTLEATLGMIGARWVLAAIAAGDDPRAIAARWQPSLAKFEVLRSRFLLY